MVFKFEIRGFPTTPMDCMVSRRSLGRLVSPKPHQKVVPRRFCQFRQNWGGLLGAPCIFPLGLLWAYRRIQLLINPEGTSMLSSNAASSFIRCSGRLPAIASLPPVALLPHFAWCLPWFILDQLGTMLDQLGAHLGPTSDHLGSTWVHLVTNWGPS